MRVSLSWLRSLVPVSLDTPALVELLTRAGLEVDAIHTVGALDPLSRVGRVVSRKALQSATHFVIDAGPSHPAVSVVSKAPNAERFDVGVPARDVAAQWQRLVAKARTITVPVIGSERFEKLVAAVAALDTAPTLQPLLEAIA